MPTGQSEGGDFSTEILSQAYLGLCPVNKLTFMYMPKVDQQWIEFFPQIMLIESLGAIYWDKDLSK